MMIVRASDGITLHTRYWFIAIGWFWARRVPGFPSAWQAALGPIFVIRWPRLDG